jgi:hypothetical protein
VGVCWIGEILNGYEDDISRFTDPTKYDAETRFSGAHDRHIFRTLHSHLPLKRIPENELTEQFLKSLYVEVPRQGVLLRNIFVIGGPGTGKTTTQRAIGYHIVKNYDMDEVQCLECNYLPDALAEANPNKSVWVIAVDDPLREQDARNPSGKRALEATNAFLEIRHVILKKKLKHQVENYMGKKMDKNTEKFLTAYHDTPDVLIKRFPRWVVEVGGVIFTIFGPQTPTIDQRLHMSKIWEIYKGFGSMDKQRRTDIKKELNKFWIEKLGQNEWRWRGLNQIEFMDKAVIKNTMTEEIGWLELPREKNIFEWVEAGAKRKQVEVKTQTDLLDEWSQWVYENMNLLQPPYSPIETKETRFMALRNLIRDIYRRNTDPRDYEELSPENQRFLESGLQGNKLISALDDRIVKIHTLKSSDKEKIKLISERLLTEMEKTNITPRTKGASRMIRHVCRKIFPDEEDFLDKKGIWKKIYDKFLYNWHQLYPNGKPIDSEEKQPATEQQEEERSDERQSETKKLIEDKFSNLTEDENIAEFDVSDKEIIDIVLKKYPEYKTASEIFMHGYGLCGRSSMTNKEMYEVSNGKSALDYGFEEKLVSVDAVKYRRKQFSGLFAQEMGFLFEEWIYEAIEKGYEIPGVLEDVEEIQHAKRGTTGYPDFVFTHIDKAKTVCSAKCYKSDRSESIQKKKFNPEIRELTDLKEKGEDARLLILYRNLGIPHMLTYRLYHNASDVPPIVTLSPSEAGLTYFKMTEK